MGVHDVPPGGTSGVTRRHASPESSRRELSYRAGALILAFAALLCLAYGIWAATTRPAPRVITRTVTRTIARPYGVPANLACITQLQEDLSTGVADWMRSHRYALPVPANGFKPDESACK